MGSNLSGIRQLDFKENGRQEASQLLDYLQVNLDATSISRREKHGAHEFDPHNVNTCEEQLSIGQ